ncbi:hypothetical protein QTP88_003661 [Uroleucon formosanum]
MAEKRKRVVLGCNQKLEIIKRLKKGETATNIAQIYGVGRTTVNDIKRDAEKIEQHVSQMQSNDGDVRSLVYSSPKSRNVTAVEEEEIDEDVENSGLDLKPLTSHSEAEAMLSKCIDWFEVQEESNATQVLLLRQIRNIAAKKAREKKSQIFFYNMCGMYVCL